MTTREHTIIEMLKRYNEAQETLTKRGIRGNGENTPTMPTTWNASYRQLEQLLRQLREERRSQWWHLMQRYVDAPIITIELPTQKRRIRGQTIRSFIVPPHTELVAGAMTIGTTTTKVRCRRWPPQVRQHKADLAIHWLSNHFAGNPCLPAEYLTAA